MRKPITWFPNRPDTGYTNIEDELKLDISDLESTGTVFSM